MSDNASKIVYTAVGAYLGYQLGPAGYAGWTALAGAGLGFAAGTYMTPEMPNMRLNNEPGSQSILTSDAPAQWIFGRRAIGGNVIFQQEEAGAQSNGEWLHVVYVLSMGSITAVDEIFLDGKSVEEYPNHVDYEVVIDPTEPNAFLLEHCDGWTEDMIGRELSWVRMSYKFDNNVFPGGIPKVQFIVRGLECYDPRTEGYAYSDNPVLQYMTVCKDLFGYPLDEFNIDAMIAGANLCDETLTNPDDSTSKRYTSGAVILATDDKPSIIQKFEQACGGCQIEIGGRRFLQPGAYYGPYDFTIDKDMVMGSISFQSEADLSDRINTVTGTFISPDSKWERTDYPRIKNSTWVTEDETELTEDLSLAYVTDVYQAQRLAWMHLKKRRTGGRIAFGMNFAGYYCRPGTVVRVYLPEINIDGEYVVDKWDLVSFSTGTDNAAACSVELSAYNSDIFDDAVGQSYAPPAYMSVPTGGVAAPTELVWTPKNEAEGIQGVLSWTPPYATVDHYNVLIENSNEQIIQTAQVPGGAASCNIGGLPADVYNMKVASVKGAARSGYVALSANINVPNMPEQVVYYADLFSITIVPSNPVNGLNGGTYEYYFSVSEVSDPVAQATKLGSGLSFTKNGLSFNTTYHFYIRSVNLYGKSGFVHLEASTSSDVGAFIAALANQITNSELAAELQEPIAAIPSLQEGFISLNTGFGEVQVSIQETQTAINNLNALITEMIDSPEYDPEESEVLEGQKRKYDGHVYEAKSDMSTPPGIPVPTDDAYWLDRGVFTSISSELDGIRADIATVQSVVDQQAQSISMIRSTSRDDDMGASELTSALNIKRAEASIVEERTARTTADTALSQLITTLQAVVDDNSAAIQTEVTARANGDSALSTLITTLQAVVDDNSAAIQTEVTARANGDSALSTLITTLQAVVDDNSAAIQTEVTARANGDSALSTLITTLQAVVDDNSAAIQTEVTARANGDSALSTLITTLQAVVDDNSAAIQTEVTARANGDSALSTLITTLQAVVTDLDTGLTNTAAVADEAKATADATTGELEATRVIKVQVNNRGESYVAGMGLSVTSGGSGTQSKIYFLGDEFAFLTSVDGTVVTPFYIEGAMVYISNAMIKNLTADNLEANTLSALFANMGTITAGKMQSTDNKMVIDLDSKIIRITA